MKKHTYRTGANVKEPDMTHNRTVADRKIELKIDLFDLLMNAPHSYNNSMRRSNCIDSGQRPVRVILNCLPGLADKRYRNNSFLSRYLNGHASFLLSLTHHYGFDNRVEDFGRFDRPQKSTTLCSTIQSAIRSLYLHVWTGSCVRFGAFNREG